MSQRSAKTLHKLRFVTGCALIGSVLTGAFLAWVPVPFDVRVVGVTVGAIAGAFAVFHAA